jgi:influenza virus NS1A-binding protein
MTTITKWSTFAGLALAIWSSNALSQQWESVSPMPTGRMGVAGVGSNGKIYALGGSTTDSLATATRANEAYSVDTNHWETLRDMPTRRRFAMAAVDNCGRIYVIGGGSPDYLPPFTRVVERYSPETDTWESLPEMPTARVHAAVTTDVRGRLWVMGGYNGTQITNVEVFDPGPCGCGEPGQWFEAAPLLVAAGEVGGATGHDDATYAIGGANTVEGCFSTAGQSLHFVQAFDRESQAWSYRNNMPTPRGLAGTTTREGLVYTIGGRIYPSARALDVVEIYDLNTDQWSSGPSLSTPRADLGAATANGIICAFGGYDADGNILDSVECLR